MRKTFKLKLGNLNQAAFAVIQRRFPWFNLAFAKSNFKVSLKFQM